MALESLVVDPSTNTAANVDSSGFMQTKTPQAITRFGGETASPNSIGCVKNYFEIDAGTITGTPYLMSPLVSEDRRLSVGVDTPLFDYSFNATAQDTSTWYYAFTTMTMTQSSGSLLVNASSSNVSGNGCYLMSKKYFSLTGNAGLHVEVSGGITSAAMANEVFLAGVGIPAAVATSPADGVWFQYTSAGLIGVLNYNGSVTQSGTLLASIPPGTTGNFKLVITERVVEFWSGNGALLGTVPVPAGNGQPFMSTALPIFIQYYNSGTVTGTSMQVKITDVHADQQDSYLNKPYPHIQAAKGLAYQGMSGGTMGGLATWVNNTNPTTALPTNTTLVANLPTGLGGQGLATLWNLAATDMIMNSYQVPVGGVSQTPRTLYITGIRISAAAFTATWTAPAAGTHIFLWGLCFGHTAVSLATAETISFVTASTKIPRRIPIGMMTWTTAATPVGTCADRDIIFTLTSPVVVNPGEFVAVAAKMINGAATATGGMFYTIAFDHYWE